MINSDEEDLSLCHYYEYLDKIKIASLSMAAIILSLFFLQSFFHKMAGVELIHIYQIIFNVALLENRLTVFYAIFKMFTYLQMNFLYLVNGESNINIASKMFEFDPSNRLFSYGILIIVYCASALVVLILSTIEGLRNISLTHLKIFLYNIFVFPFTMVFLFLVHFQNYQINTEENPLWSNFFLISAHIVMILVVYYEWKMLFFKGRSS